MKPFIITSILAPTGLSDSSIPALRYARLFGDRFGAKLTVVYVAPIVYPVSMAGPADGLYIHTPPQHQALLRAEVERHAAPVMAGRPYDIDVTIGLPVPAILTSVKERHADLVIMAHTSGTAGGARSSARSARACCTVANVPCSRLPRRTATSVRRLTRLHTCCAR